MLVWCVMVALIAMVLSAAAAGGAPQRTPSADSGLVLDLNLPAYRLEARRGAAVLATMRVAIGQREHPTPRGRFQIGSITWNPWWFPPPFPWAANDTVTPPCPTNPVGRVKIQFATLHFLHGTPAPQSIGRAASHGCVRASNEDALALARLLVGVALPDSIAAAARHAEGSATVRMRLPTPVPLVIRYDLAEVRGGELVLHPDPYARAPGTAARRRIALAALAAAGLDTARTDRRLLDHLIARSRRGTTSLALEGLTAR
jgi:murein L,D-transpeptidase YcbB/YkuD